MPGRYRFPRPSRRLRQTRRRQQKLESHDLPVNRRSVAPGAICYCRSPSARLICIKARHGLTGPRLAGVPTCAGECRFVCGKPVGNAVAARTCGISVGHGHAGSRALADRAHRRSSDGLCLRRRARRAVESAPRERSLPAAVDVAERALRAGLRAGPQAVAHIGGQHQPLRPPYQNTSRAFLLSVSRWPRPGTAPAA